MLCRIDQQQFLSGMHIHQVPSVDSAKLLNVEKIKLNTRPFYAKKTVCGACTHKIEKKILLYKPYSRRAVIIVTFDVSVTVHHIYK